MHTEGDISTAGVSLEKGADGRLYLVAPHVDDPDEQGTCVQARSIKYMCFCRYVTACVTSYHMMRIAVS